MINNELSLPDGSPRRIAFAHASSLLVAQALTDANALLVRHFPTLAWATWGAALRELQPDVLVHGSAVTFDWQDLARRVQGLASESAPPALAPPATGPTAAELTAELQTYQRLAAFALAQLPECPRACGLLARELLTKLAHGRALAERVNDAMPGASQQPATTLCPSVVEPPNAAEGASSSLGEGRGGRHPAWCARRPEQCERIRVAPPAVESRRSDVHSATSWSITRGGTASLGSRCANSAAQCASAPPRSRKHAKTRATCR